MSRALYFSLKRPRKVPRRVKCMSNNDEAREKTTNAVALDDQKGIGLSGRPNEKLSKQDLAQKVRLEYELVGLANLDYELDADRCLAIVSGKLKNELVKHTNDIWNLLRRKQRDAPPCFTNYYPFVANCLERGIASEFGYQTYPDVIKHSEMLTKDPSKREIFEKYQKTLGEVTVEQLEEDLKRIRHDTSRSIEEMIADLSIKVPFDVTLLCADMDAVGGVSNVNRVVVAAWEQLYPEMNSSRLRE